MERFSDWLKANSYVDVNIDKWMPLDEALKQLKTSEEALENTINNLNSDTSIKEDDCFWVDDYGGKWVSRLVVASLQGWEDAVNQAELGEKFTESLVIKKLTEKIAALTEENAYLEKKESSIKDNSAELESFKSKYNKDIASRDSKIESLQESLDEVKSNAEKLAEEYASFKEEAEKDKQQALSKQGGKYANKVATLEADLVEASKKKEKAEADLGILTASLRKKDEELALHKSAGSKLPELVDSLKAVRAQLEEERKNSKYLETQNTILDKKYYEETAKVSKLQEANKSYKERIDSLRAKLSASTEDTEEYKNLKQSLVMRDQRLRTLRRKFRD